MQQNEKSRRRPGDELPQLMHEGWLLKKTTGWPHRWQRRWFVLSGTSYATVSRERRSLHLSFALVRPFCLKD